MSFSPTGVQSKPSGSYRTCADEAVMLVTVPVVTVTEFSRNIPLFRRANALSTVARA